GVGRDERGPLDVAGPLAGDAARHVPVEVSGGAIIWWARQSPTLMKVDCGGCHDDPRGTAPRAQSIHSSKGHVKGANMSRAFGLRRSTARLGFVIVALAIGLCAIAGDPVPIDGSAPQIDCPSTPVGGQMLYGSAA